MSDCSNAEMRDLLPDLVHGTLAGSERARVEGHVADCAECTSEMALLRATRRALASNAPAVSTAAIVRALPLPPAPPPAGVVSIEDARQRRRNSERPRTLAGLWRAAAVLLVAAGATTVAVVGRAPSRQAGRDDGAAVAKGGQGSDARTVAVSESAAITGPRERGRAAADAGISMAGGVGDLSDDALVALLDDIGNLDSAPATEPGDVVPNLTGEEESR